MKPSKNPSKVVCLVLLLIPSLCWGINKSSEGNCGDDPGCGDGNDGGTNSEPSSLRFRFKVGSIKTEPPGTFANLSRLGGLERGFKDRVRSFDDFFNLYYGGGAIKRSSVALEFRIPQINESAYHPSVLEIHNEGVFQVTNKTHEGQQYIHQVLADTSFAQVDPLASGTGFRIRSWKNMDGIPNLSGEFYETPAGKVLSEVVFQKPPNVVGSNELYIFFTENFGLTSSYSCVEHHVYDSNTDTLTVTTYAGNNVESPLHLIKRETLDYERVPNGKIWDYSFVRTMEEASNLVGSTVGGIGELKVISKTKESFIDLSESAEGGETGRRRMTEMVTDFGGENLTTSYSYYDDPSEDFAFSRLKSVERPDGSWEYHEIVDSVDSPIPQVTVYRSYLDTTIENREQGLKVVSEYEATKVTKTSSIGEVVIARETTESETLPTGAVIITEKEFLGVGENAPASTTVTAYADFNGSALNNGRPISRFHPDGTVTLWKYTGSDESLTITESTGESSGGEIIDGVETVTFHNCAYEPIQEVVTDIESGELISSRTSIGVDGGNVDPQGRPTKWTYNGNPDDYSETIYGCCGPEKTRSRTGEVTTYFRDALRRVYRASTKRSSTGPTVNLETATNGLEVTRQRKSGSETIFISKVTRNLSGLSVTSELPDADNDGNRETMTRSMNYAAADGPTTTTTYPDATTTVSVEFLDGKRKTSTDQEGHVTTYTYGTHQEAGGGTTATMRPPGSGEQTTEFRDLLGRTFQMTYADGAAMLRTYYSFAASVAVGQQGKLQSVTEPDGITTTYRYNTEGERTTTISPMPMASDGSPQERVTFSETDSVAAITIQGVEIAPARRTTVQVNGITTAESYRSVDGRLSGTISFARESLTDTTVPVDGAWASTVTNLDGTKTVSSYDDGLMVSTASYPSGVTPDESNHLERNDYTHDPFGRVLTQAHSRTGIATMGTYLDTGALLSVTDAGQRTTSFSYDKLGRRLSVDAPDTSNPAGGTYANVTYTSYYPDGQTKATWGGQVYPRFYEYDEQNRIIALHTYPKVTGSVGTDTEEMDPDGADPEEAESEVADSETTDSEEMDPGGTGPAETGSGELSAPGTSITSWLYDDKRGWLNQKKDADGKGASYTYTRAGRLKTRTWARGVVTTYDYDKGALISTTYSEDGNITPDLAYTYDDFGRLKQVYRGSDLSTLEANELHAEYDYNAFLLTSEKLNQDTALSRTLTRNYDQFRRPQSLTLGSDHTVGYGYDDGGRLDQVWDHPVLTDGVPQGSADFTYGYTIPDSYGLIHTVTGPAHTVTNTWESDRDVLDTRSNNLNAAGNPLISKYDYTVNAIGQRTAVAQSGSAFSGTPAISWSYDALGQVTSADSSVTESNVAIHDRAYAYDAIGNRVASEISNTQISDPPAPATTTSYTANALNQYQGAGAITGAMTAAPGFDDDGNAIAYPMPADVSANAILTWDAENRLVKVVMPGSGPTITYDYDYLSRRVSRSVGVSPAILTHYPYDGWNCIAEYTGTTLQKTYTWGMDLSGSMQGAGGVGGLLVVTDKAATGDPVYYPTYDGNGNVSEYLDATGAVVAHYEYDPFGNDITPVAQEGSKQDDFDHRFSTKPIDTTGLYYYGYRYYDPVTGRWPSRDPIEEEGGVNLYAFVGNQSVNRIDYLGNSSVDLSSKIKDFLLPRAQAGWDGSIPIAKPFIAPIGAFLQVHLYATLIAKPCCDKDEGDIDLMWEARGGIEAFLQWGHTFNWGSRNHGSIQPNQGYRDRSWHADFRARTEDCPDSAFEVADWSIVAFLRGSTGVGIGVQGSVEFTVAQNNFDPDSLWDRFNATGSVAWGVVGASVELGVGGSVGFKGKVELPD